MIDTVTQSGKTFGRWIAAFYRGLSDKAQRRIARQQQVALDQALATITQLELTAVVTGTTHQAELNAMLKAHQAEVDGLLLAVDANRAHIHAMEHTAITDAAKMTAMIAEMTLIADGHTELVQQMEDQHQLELDGVTDSNAKLTAQVARLKAKGGSPAKAKASQVQVDYVAEIAAMMAANADVTKADAARAIGASPGTIRKHWSAAADRVSAPVGDGVPVATEGQLDDSQSHDSMA